MSLTEAAALAMQKIKKINGMHGTVEEIENSIKASYSDASSFIDGWENRVWSKNGDYSENYCTLSADGATFKIKFSAKIKPLDEDGVYFNLYNNAWGTNFPMWYDEDARFRFVLNIKE